MMYSMVTHIARVWINRVRLPILLVVSWTEKMNISLSPSAPENLVSRDGFGSPVPRQPAHLHTQAGSGAYLRDSSRVPQRRPFIYLQPPYAIGSIPSMLGRAIAYRWRSVRRHGDSKPQDSSERVLPGQVTMDQLIFASLSHTNIGMKWACWKYRRWCTILFLFCFWTLVWCPCMAINLSVQYNGGHLPDIILLTQCYLHRGTRLNAMKRFSLYSLWSHLKVLTFFPPNWGMLRRSS